MNVQPYIKTVLTFLGTVATNAAADWMAHGAPIPETWGDGLRWAGTIVATTLLVNRVPNFYTVQQAQTKLDIARNRVDEGKQAR